MEETTAVYAKLNDRPGVIATVTRAIADKRVNIQALQAETWQGMGFIRIVCDRPREAIQALRGINVETYESEIVLASLPDKPGEIARATSELSAAGLNVEAMTVTVDGRVAFRTNDPRTTAQVLRKL